MSIKRGKKKSKYEGGQIRFHHFGKDRKILINSGRNKKRFLILKVIASSILKKSLFSLLDFVKCQGKS